MNSSDFTDLIATVAPTIAGALGGPLAGLAARAIAVALTGREDAAVEEVQSRLAAASPSELAALKTAEIDFRSRLKALDIDLERIAAGDRGDARRREIRLRDQAPMILAAVVTFGFFGALGLVLRFGLQPQGGEAVLVMLGALATGWTAVLNYYFGSSAGSAAKNALLERLTEVRS
jgi:hypothetical protein